MINRNSSIAKRLFKKFRNRKKTYLNVTLIKGAILLVTVACIIHLYIGAKPDVVFIAGITFLISIYPVIVFGFLDFGSVLLALIGFRYVGFPIFAKLFFGQPLDTNLYSPTGSFVLIFIGILGYLAALKTTSLINIKKSLLQNSTSPYFLIRVSLLSALVGIAANILVSLRIEDQYTGVNVAAFFVSFLHLSLISGIARAIIKSNGHRSIDIWVFTLFAIEIIFAMVLNSRMSIMDAFLCWLVTSISYRAKLCLKHLVVTIVIFTLMISFITPIFLYLRGIRSDLPWTDRISATIEIAKNWKDAFEDYMDWRAVAERVEWYRNYYGQPQNVLERMSHINNVDILKNGADINSTVGIADFKYAFKRTMPRIIEPNKPVDHSQGSWLFWSVGIPNSGSFPNAPLIGTGYVAFGLLGSFLYPFLLSLIWLIVLKKISGFNLQNNIWAIYFFIRIHNEFVEGSSDAYLLHIIRIIPQDFILLWITNLLSQGEFLRPWKKRMFTHMLS